MLDRDDTYLVSAILLWIIIMLLLVLAIASIFSPVEEVIAKGTISRITIHDNYYTYEVTTNGKILNNLISANFYKLHSECPVYYRQNFLGFTGQGQFV